MLRQICLLLIFVTMFSMIWVAEARAAGINVVVNQDSVTLNVSLQLYENLTSLPQASIFLDKGNSTAVLDSMETAINGMVPGSHVALLEAWIRTIRTDPATNTWALKENYTVVVVGAISNLGGLVSSNLAFLSMKITDSFRPAGLEINNVGAQYLLGPLSSLAPVGTTIYYIDRGRNLQPLIPKNVTAGFSMLDFSWVPAISQWSSTYQPFQSSTIWELSPASPYNLTIGLAQTPEGNFQQVIKAVLNPTLELTAPARAFAQGTRVLFNLPTTADIVMPVIVVASMVVALASFMVDRRLTGRVRLKKKKR